MPTWASRTKGSWCTGYTPCDRHGKTLYLARAFSVCLLLKTNEVAILLFYFNFYFKYSSITGSCFVSCSSVVEGTPTVQGLLCGL